MFLTDLDQEAYFGEIYRLLSSSARIRSLPDSLPCAYRVASYAREVLGHACNSLLVQLGGVYLPQYSVILDACGFFAT